MNNLFTPFNVKSLELKNRIVMSPMCQYSANKKDGKPNDWHFFHYTTRAIGGAGLIIMEMTLVDPDGRSTDFDLGIWSEEHIPAFSRIVEQCQRYGSKIALQIGHAGRKAEDVTIPVAPSPIPFNSNFKTPITLTNYEVKELVEKYRLAAKRAVIAGFDAIEIHGAHGYLIHQFHSPLTNKRTDEYGEDRTKFGVEVIQAMKSELPAGMPLLMRISGKEYAENGYGIDYSIEFCKEYKKAGVDIFDVSSGGEGPINSTGNVTSQKNKNLAINRKLGFQAGYQVPLAREIKNRVGVPVIAVGKLGEPDIANFVIENGDADLVAIGRSMLKNPFWALEAEVKLGKSKAWYGGVERYKKFTEMYH